jgi:hypothetical protein
VVSTAGSAVPARSAVLEVIDETLAAIEEDGICILGSFLKSLGQISQP